ncbi:MAG TPA: SCO family protein [Hanamia sp.]|jgi:protein SCO1|nr:SCO family protein [Hanamia sp.]
MKSILKAICLALLLWNCSDTSNKSAFEGTPKSATTAPVGTLSSESIYMLPDTFQTQDNKNVTLKDFAGKPTVVGMIFTNCSYACPRLTSDMKNIEDSLKPENGKINFLLISFDSERDSAAQLKKFAKNLDLDTNWTLLHGSEQAVRTLSVLLNVQFEKDAEGNFSHSNIISALDKGGVLRFQKEGLNADATETIKNIAQLQ